MPLAEPRSAVAAWPTKPVAVAWAKNVPILTSIRPTITAKRLGSSKRGSPSPASARAHQNVGRGPICRALVAFARIWREVLELIRLTFPFFRVYRRVAFDRYVGPDF